MKEKDLFAKGALDSLKNLSSDFHAKLGDDLYDKVCKAIPEIKQDMVGREHGILWWVVHNQLEAIGRVERCKDLFLQLKNNSFSNSECIAYGLGSALDHLKQNLTFLVGNLTQHPSDSYYVLDRFLDTSVYISSESVEEIFRPVSAADEALNSMVSLDNLLQVLQGHIKAEISDMIVMSLKEFLHSADLYYVIVNRFLNCPPDPITVVVNFRKTQSAGMQLLSKTILAEMSVASITSLIKQ